MIEILNAYTKAVLYTSTTATEIARAVIEAARAKADLSGADLREAYLSGADLSGAYLSGADLSGADLREAYLSGAYLSGADLRGAYLSGADLREAYLSGADLSGAYLSGADLRGAKGITPQVLQILGTRHAVIVRSYGEISIGCRTESLEWWEKHYKATGRSEEYTAEQIAEYGEHIAACRRFMERYSLLEAPKEAPAEKVSA